MEEGETLSVRDSTKRWAFITSRILLVDPVMVGHFSFRFSSRSIPSTLFPLFFPERVISAERRNDTMGTNCFVYSKSLTRCQLSLQRIPFFFSFFFSHQSYLHSFYNLSCKAQTHSTPVQIFCKQYDNASRNR